MGKLRVVSPTECQLVTVAGLRFDWAVGNGHVPIGDKRAFTDAFLRWTSDHGDSHQCLVVVDVDDKVVGFGFLALTRRVPVPHRNERRSGDIQAVYIAPEHRNSGIGGQLLEALIEIAHRRGVEHLTVHSSQQAVTAYQRAGFTVDPLMMYQDGAAPTH